MWEKGIEAEFTVEDEQEDERNINNNSISIVTKPYRHPLLVEEKSSEYIKEVEKELALDARLGLSRISKKTAVKSLKKDIDELTSVHDFHEISKKELNKLFEIDWMNLIYCKPHNILQKFTVGMKILIGTPQLKILGFCSLLFITLGYYSFLNISIPVRRMDTIYTILHIFSISLAIVIPIFWIKEIVNFRFEKEAENYRNLGSEEQKKKVISFSTIKVSLNVVPLDQAETDIPFGAKLRTAEALDSKIFESFVIASPKFEVQKHNFEIKEKVIPKINLDPAICGVTKDGRLYMIVCWDIKKDIDKTKKSIKRFQKYKI